MIYKKTRNSHQSRLFDPTFSLFSLSKYMLRILSLVNLKCC